MSGTANREFAAPWLIGTWQLLRSEAPLELQPGTRMHFAADESLVYSIPTAERHLTVTLRWRLDGAILHTMHEDGSNPVAVRVSLGEADVMAFDFDGPHAWFIRVG